MADVLIADDDINVCQCLEKAVGWDRVGVREVRCAMDGAQAYEMMTRRLPDVLITDIKMPMLDGAGLLKRVRETWSNVDVIFLSAYEDFKTAQIAIQYDVCDYILKPLNRDSLLSVERAVANALRRRAQRRRCLETLSDERGGEIARRLADGDAAFFQELFYQYSASLMTRDGAFVESTCMMLLRVLFAHLADGSMPAQLAAARREQCFREAQTIRNAQELVSYVYERYLEALDAQATGQAGATALFEEIRHKIRENYGNPDFSVSAVAQAMHFSPDYINRIFSERAGVSVSQYIIRLRIRKAAELLTATDLSVNAVASMVGYGDANYFSKAFRREHGVAPSEYRAQARRLRSN